MLAQQLLDVNKYDIYTPKSFYADVKILKAHFNTLADYSYRIALLDKGNGKKRRLTIPNDNLKTMQSEIYAILNCIYMNLLNTNSYKHLLPTIAGFMPGKSVVDNAVEHLNNHIIVNNSQQDLIIYKGDIKQFFDNINFRLFSSKLKASIVNARYFHTDNQLLCSKHACIFDRALSELVIIIKKVCFYYGALPQGSPTSPVISNIFLLDFDRDLYRKVRQNYHHSKNVTYTRYADDICISLGNELKDYKSKQNIKYYLTNIVNALLKPYSLHLNKDKIELLGNHKRMSITGVCINRREKEFNYVLDSVQHKDNKLYIELYDWTVGTEAYVIKGAKNYSANTPNIKRKYLKAKIDKLIHDFDSYTQVNLGHFKTVIGYWSYVNNLNIVNYFKYRKEIKRLQQIWRKIPKAYQKILNQDILKPYQIVINAYIKKTNYYNLKK